MTLPARLATALLLLPAALLLGLAFLTPLLKLGSLSLFSPAGPLATYATRADLRGTAAFTQWPGQPEPPLACRKKRDWVTQSRHSEAKEPQTHPLRTNPR